MKSTSHYIDLDDQIPAARPAPSQAVSEQPYTATAATTKPASPLWKVRTWATLGAGLASSILIITLSTQASIMNDPAAAIAAWALLATIAGIGAAVLLSWLLTASTEKSGFAKVEPVAQDSRVKWSWNAIPLYPHLGTRYLVRAMKQRPAVRYRYELAFKECKLSAFAAHAGMHEKVRLAIGTYNPQQKAQWYDGAEGGWKVCFRVGVSAPDPVALANARDVMQAALVGTFHGIGFENAGRTRREAYLFGEELTPEAMVPKELAPDVPSGVAVEAHAPVAMRSDIPLGKVVEPETLDAIADAGILHAHLDGGLVVAGGRVAERVALFKIILSHSNPLTPVVIDDHGDCHVPGAAILEPGPGFTINPLLPSSSGGNGLRQHVSLVIAALAAIHAFSQDQEAFLATRVQEFVDAAALKGLAPEIGDLIAILASDAKSQPEKAVALAVQRDFAGWAKSYTGMQDVPSLETLVQSGKPVVVDLSSVPGAEKQVLKAMLILKMISLGSTKVRKPILAVVPDFDKVFHDERSDRLPPRAAQGIDKVANALAGSVARFVLTVQDPVKLPQQVLAHASTVIAFRQPSAQARDTITQALGLEDEQLYDRSRHASYQHKYLSELPPGMAFLRRPDVSSPFLVAVDLDAAGKLLPRRKLASSGASTTPAGDPLESVLLQFGLVKQDVVNLLDAMNRSGNQGVKKDWMADILAEKCLATIKRREPDLPAKDAEVKAHGLTARIMETLVARGILAEDGFNPSGLKKGVTAKMTQYGQAALERTATSSENVVTMNPVHEHVLSTEKVISEQYPDGDVAVLGERLLSDIVAVFQDLDARDELDSHTDLLARCNQHAAALGEALESDDRAAIVSALAPMIEDFRLISSAI